MTSVMKQERGRLEFTADCLRSTCLVRAYIAATEGRAITPEECARFHKCMYAPKKGMGK